MPHLVPQPVPQHALLVKNRAKHLGAQVGAQVGAPSWGTPLGAPIWCLFFGGCRHASEGVGYGERCGVQFPKCVEEAGIALRPQGRPQAHGATTQSCMIPLGRRRPWTGTKIWQFWPQAPGWQVAGRGFGLGRVRKSDIFRPRSEEGGLFGQFFRLCRNADFTRWFA